MRGLDDNVTVGTDRIPLHNVSESIELHTEANLKISTISKKNFEHFKTISASKN